MRQAMIFAAGLGTRLRPLTDTRPKALVTVAGVPLLDYVLMSLRNAGFERVVINVHHFADMIISHLNASDHFGLDIRVSDERQKLLDTGGGIRAARPLFSPASPVLLHNVDIISNADLRALYDTALTSNADATLLVSHRESSRYLIFGDRPARQLVEPTRFPNGYPDSPNYPIAGKRALPENSMFLRGWCNTKTREFRGPVTDMSPDEASELQSYAFSGIHVISPRLWSEMDSWPDSFGIIDFYLDRCADHPILGITQDNLNVLDIGKPETLAAAQEAVGFRSPSA